MLNFYLKVFESKFLTYLAECGAIELEFTLKEIYIAEIILWAIIA